MTFITTPPSIASANRQPVDTSQLTHIEDSYGQHYAYAEPQFEFRTLNKLARWA